MTNLKTALRCSNVWAIRSYSLLTIAVGEFAMQLGVDGAPETYVVDEHGMIRYRHSGYMDRETWLTEIKPKLDELTKK